MWLPRFAILLSFSALLASSCVTVNVPVTFPESAVQQQTDSYVRELYRAKEKGRGPTQQPSPKASPTPEARIEFIASVWAAEEEPSFQVNSPKTKEIQEREATRIEELLPLEHEGTLGEANDGFLVIKNSGALKSLLKKKVNKLVDEENADRKALYKEILKINGSAIKIKNVETSFARSFQLAAPSGTWVQAPDGTWDQKQ
ncbi:MAG: DUF1318 domain-containing protein [Bdellovibrionota bacterium]